MKHSCQIETVFSTLNIEGITETHLENERNVLTFLRETKKKNPNWSKILDALTIINFLKQVQRFFGKTCSTLFFSFYCCFNTVSEGTRVIRPLCSSIVHQIFSSLFNGSWNTFTSVASTLTTHLYLHTKLNCNQQNLSLVGFIHLISYVTEHYINPYLNQHFHSSVRHQLFVLSTRLLRLVYLYDN